MKHKPAFTIIELLLVIALSSVVILGLMQAYNSIINYIKTIQEIQGTNRKVCLLFNQMERDFMTAFIPPIFKKIKPEKDGGDQIAKTDDKTKDQQNLPKDTQEKEDQKTQETRKKFFMANIDDNAIAKRINNHRTYPFKNVTLINTNPLQVYGDRRARVSRVLYELVVDKKRTKDEAICYNLWRRETEDLQNYKCKEDEVGITTKSKATQVRKFLVADGIKELYVQYVYQGRPKIKEDGKEKEDETKVEERVFDTWGDKKETIGVVPQRVNVYITFWDEKLSKKTSMQATFPIMSFTLLKSEEKKDEAPATQTQPQAGQQGTAGQTPQGGMPPAPTTPGAQI